MEHFGGGLLDLGWWINAIEIPVVGAIFWFLRNVSKSTSEGDAKLHRRIDELSEKFGACQVHCAVAYVTKDSIERIENRIDERLGRFEEKLDRFGERLGEGKR